MEIASPGRNNNFAVCLQLLIRDYRQLKGKKQQLLKKKRDLRAGERRYVHAMLTEFASQYLLSRLSENSSAFGMKTAPGAVAILRRCLFIYVVLQIQQVSNHGWSIRADEPSWQRRIQRGICCAILCIHFF